MTRGIFARMTGEHRVCLAGDYLMEGHELQSGETDEGTAKVKERKMGGQGNFMNHLLPFQFNIWCSYDPYDWRNIQHDETFTKKASRWETSPTENFSFPRKKNHFREYFYGVEKGSVESGTSPTLYLRGKMKYSSEMTGEDWEAESCDRKVFDQLESFSGLVNCQESPETVSIVFHEHHGEDSLFSPSMAKHWDVPMFYRETLRVPDGAERKESSHVSLWLDYRHPEMMAQGVSRELILEAFRKGYPVNVKSNEIEAPKALEAIKDLFKDEDGNVTLYRTMGSKGCEIIPLRRLAFESDILPTEKVPAPLTNIRAVDNIGAGDTFFAWLLAGRIRFGLGPIEAARLAMIAAGCSVEEAGPFVVFPDTVFRKIASVGKSHV